MIIIVVIVTAELLVSGPQATAQWTPIELGVVKVLLSINEARSYHPPDLHARAVGVAYTCAPNSGRER